MTKHRIENGGNSYLTDAQEKFLTGFLTLEEFSQIDKNTKFLCIHRIEAYNPDIDVTPNIVDAAGEQVSEFKTKIKYKNGDDFISIDIGSDFKGHISYWKSMKGHSKDELINLGADPIVVEIAFMPEIMSNPENFKPGTVELGYESFLKISPECEKFLKYVRNRIGELEDLGIEFSSDEPLLSIPPISPATK